MNTLFFITSLLFFITLLRSCLFLVSLWQRKEYRLDRFLIHLQETKEGKELFFSKLLLLKLLAIVLYGVVFMYPATQVLYDLFVFFLFAWNAFYFLKDIVTGNLKRPILTIKTGYLIVLPIIFITIFYFFPIVTERFLWLLILDRLGVFIVAFFVLTLWLPTEFYRDLQIEKAIKKLSHHKKLIVIGVTGSYGKSSTKEYIAQVLEHSFKVVKTKGTNNTPIGIAQTVLRYLQKDTQIFVAEMGAYKRGEIAQLCRIVHPRIGVLTGISDQHISLFGSLENTRKTKYELIESLPHNGFALFNGNNKDVLNLYKKTHRRKLLYIVGKESQTVERKDAIVASNAQMQKDSVSFDTVLSGHLTHFSAPLIGLFATENILPGVAIGLHLGMKIADIQKAVAGLIPPPKTMRLLKLSNGALGLDNSFSANPQAVLSIIDYLSLYKKKKILVLAPLIELGKNAWEEHAKIGRKLVNICGYVLLTNKNFEEAIQEGIEEKNGKCKIIGGSDQKLADFILENTKKDDMIAYVGRETGKVLQRTI